MQEYEKIIGRNIKELRWKLGLTKEELADDVKCSTHSIRHWEEGRGIPSGYYLVQLADRLGCSIDYLFGRATK